MIFLERNQRDFKLQETSPRSHDSSVTKITTVTYNRSECAANQRSPSLTRGLSARANKNKHYEKHGYRRMCQKALEVPHSVAAFVGSNFSRTAAAVGWNSSKCFFNLYLHILSCRHWHRCAPCTPIDAHSSPFSGVQRPRISEASSNETPWLD